MPKQSPARADVTTLPGLKLLHRGKVRDTYDLGDGLLLVVVTDAISIFDHVLNALVPEKGIVLNCLTHFWLTKLEPFGIRTHFVAAGADLRPYLPPSLQVNVDLLRRSMVVKQLKMIDVEFVARGNLTGSSWSAYEKDQAVCGRSLPPALQDGDLLPYVLDTPKTEVGHDVHLDAAGIFQLHPEETRLSLAIFEILRHHASQSGIVLADTKLEFGKDVDGQLTLGDEVGTPDSSRFWSETEWIASRTPADGRQSPTSYDKQYVRAWGKSVGIDRLDPAKEADVDAVQRLVVPDDVVRRTRRIYRYIFWRLTGKTLERYCTEDLGIPTKRRSPRVTILLGGESDAAHVRAGIRRLTHALEATGYPIEEILSLHVVSCHRNPIDLQQFASRGCRISSNDPLPDAVVCCGGKAFALPGVLNAWLESYGHDIPVVGVALGETEESRNAALLSIAELPGEPVVMDELTNEPYHGSSGVADAVRRVVEGELPPPKTRTEKPPKFNLPLFG